MVFIKPPPMNASGLLKSITLQSPPPITELSAPDPMVFPDPLPIQELLALMTVFGPKPHPKSGLFQPPPPMEEPFEKERTILLTEPPMRLATPSEVGRIWSAA